MATPRKPKTHNEKSAERTAREILGQVERGQWVGARVSVRILMHYLRKLEPPMSEEEPRDDEPDSDSVLGLVGLFS